MSGFEIGSELKAGVATGLIRRGEVIFGNFELRDGSWSPVYVDLRPTASAVENNSRAPGMSRADQLQFRRVVVDTYATMLGHLDGEYEHIQGIPEAVMGIAPMVGLVANASYLHRRIKMKQHGLAENLLGDYNEGDRSVLLDDLISSSGAKVEERDLVVDITQPRDKDGTPRGFGLVIEHALTLLDRQTGGIQAAKAKGLQVDAAVTISEVFEIGSQESLITPAEYRVVSAYVAGELTRKEDVHNFL